MSPIYGSWYGGPHSFPRLDPIWGVWYRIYGGRVWRTTQLNRGIRLCGDQYRGLHSLEGVRLAKGGGSLLNSSSPCPRVRPSPRRLGRHHKRTPKVRSDLSRHLSGSVMWRICVRSTPRRQGRPGPRRAIGHRKPGPGPRFGPSDYYVPREGSGSPSSTLTHHHHLPQPKTSEAELSKPTTHH